MRRTLITLIGAAICSTALFAQITQDSLITSLAGATWTFPGDVARATDAPLSQVVALATDAKGNIVFADPGNHVVNRLNADGSLTVIAGNGIRGLSGDGGPALSASLNSPTDVAVDSHGNLYIVDSFNNVIRKVTTDGKIDTVIVNVRSSGRIALDRSDNLYLTDLDRCVIYRSTPAIDITTYAGNGTCGHAGDGGPATAARIFPSAGLATDAAGNLYIAEDAAYYLRKISPAGIISTIAGTGSPGFAGDGGPATAASVIFPHSIVVDAGGNIFFSDVNVEVVRKISPDGIISTVAGTQNFAGYSGDGGPAAKALFSFPEGLAFDAAGRLYVSDSGNDRIRRIDGGVISTVAGNGQFRIVPDGTPSTQAFLFGPDGVTFDAAGNLLVAEVAASKVAKITPDGKFSILAGTGTTGKGGIGGPARNALLDTPRALAADPQGNVYVSDNLANVVYKITADGRLLLAAGTVFTSGYSGDGGQATDAKLRAPYGVALDAPGNLYIADRSSHVIRRVAPDGTISTFAGTGTSGFSGDGGAATSAMLAGPQSLAVDPSGALLICDRNNNRIRRVTPEGVISTVAGDGRADTLGDGGPAIQASIDGPFSMNVDRAGNIYFLESSGAVLRRVDITGSITTIAGVPLLLLNLFDGSSAGAALLDVDGIAIDNAGNLYMPSFNSDTIRVILTAEPTYTTSLTGLSFTAQSGGAPTESQTVAVDASFQSIFVAIAADSPWLKIQNSFGFAFSPFNLQVQADPKGLAAGSYQGNVTLTRYGSLTPFANVAVTFTVGATAPPKLAVEPASLTVSALAGGPAHTQSFRVLNSGGGSLDFRVAVQGAAAGSITLSAQSGTVQAGTPLTVTATIDPRSLTAGTATATLAVSSATGGTANIPVTITVTPRPQQLTLPQRGLLFTAVQGGGVTPPRAVTVLNTGSGSFPWTATAIGLQGGDWLKVTPASGTSVAGSSSSVVTVSADPSRLSTPGVYYGLVRIASTSATNAPQDVEVVLNFQSPDNSPGSLLTPSGLVFTAVAGASPSSQTFTITNLNASPAQFRVSGSTLDGGSWLQALPNTTLNPLAPGASQVITVQPDVRGQPPGVYYGTLVVQFAGFHRDVDVLLVIAPAGASSPKARSAGSCAPTALLPTFTSFLQDFNVPAAWPTPLEVKVVDDCGNPQTSGRVVVNFSNGDPPLPLLTLNDGRWQGTWFGRNTRAGQLTVNINADTDAPKLHGAKPYTGTLQSNDSVPAVTSGGVSSAAPAPAQAPIAPGGLISINGRSFAPGPTSASRLPLGTNLGGTQVLLAGRSLPLIYSSSGQISAVVPYDIDPDAQYSLLVSSPAAVSGPETVAMAGAQPAVFLVDATGDPAVATKLWSQLLAGTPVDPSTIAPASPVKAGDKLVVYCTGLGVVDGNPDVSIAAPASPPKVRNTVQATIGTAAATVTLAALVPGLTGVYQVQLTVPAGIAPGDGIPLVLSSLGQKSAAVNLSVR